MPTPTQTAPAAAAASPDFNLTPPADTAPPAQSLSGAPSATRSGTQSGTQPGTQSGTQAGTPAGTQSGAPGQGGTIATQTGQTIDAGALPGEAGLSGTEAVIGTAILLVLAVGIFFVRGAVRSHLIGQRASPSAASSAGWALFALLLALCVLVLFGLLGDLWGELAFTVPLSIFTLLMLVLFVLLYRAAARGRQGRPRS